MDAKPPKKPAAGKKPSDAASKRSCVSARAGDVRRSQSSAPQDAARPRAGEGRPQSIAPRQFEQREGFSVLAPDQQKHKDLLRRQRLSEQAKAKPKPDNIRVHQVLDSSRAAESTAEREAARNRWVEEMQAKADPKQIRLAARQRDEEKRQQEKLEEIAKRKQFEQDWYARQALCQEAQQQRNIEVNAKARQRWAEAALPQVQSAHEPVIPAPENVDFAAVRQRMAAERASRGAAIVRSRASSSDSQARSHQGQASSAQVILAQDAEFQVGLLHDQLKSLEKQCGDLRGLKTSKKEEIEEQCQRRRHAEQRLERYGENPKLQAEIDEAMSAEEAVLRSLQNVEQRLSESEAEIEVKKNLLRLAESHMA